jgi:CBS domain-containing protein
MANARDIMTGDAECVSANDTLTDAARKLRDLQVGATPICGDDNRLKGMLTDRDIVVKCIAAGGDPAPRRWPSWPRANRSPSVQTTRWKKRCGP